METGGRYERCKDDRARTSLSTVDPDLERVPKEHEEKRGREEGHELEDWIVAEDRRLGGAGEGLVVPAASMHLAQIIAAGKVAVVADTGKIKTPDFRLLSRSYASSLHVPLVLGEQNGLVSFWSGEKSGFPPEAVTLLESLAAEFSVDGE